MKKILKLAFGDVGTCGEEPGCVLTLDGDYGFIDQTGTIVIEPIYDQAESFYERMAVVRKNNQDGYIDKSGRLVNPFRNGFAFVFSGGLAAVELEGKVGFIDTQGKVVIPAQFDRDWNTVGER